MKVGLGSTCALALVIATCTGGVASAKGGCKKDACRASIQKENFSCGENHPELPVLGKVSFVRRENRVTLAVEMKHGEPDATYEVFLLGKNTCSSLGTAFSFKTSAKGRGRGSGALDVPAAAIEFFADVLRPGCVNGHCHSETPTVAVVS